jgi:hypothetical protein
MDPIVDPSRAYVEAILEQFDAMAEDLEDGEIIAILVDAPGELGKMFVTEVKNVAGRMICLVGKVHAPGEGGGLMDARVIASIDSLRIAIARWPADGSEAPPKLRISR